MPRSTFRTKIVTVITICLLLGLWHLGSMLLDAAVILPTPHSTLVSVWKLLQYKPLSLHLLTTIGRALQSFLIIIILGGILGVAAGYNKLVAAALQPVVVLFKATPVMSIILLAFIWFTSGTVPIFGVKNLK